MRTVTLADPHDFAGWRAAARALALERVPPAEVEWTVGEGRADLFASPSPLPAGVPDGSFSVPRAFLTLAETVIRHDDPERFGLLYTMLLRLLVRPDALDEGPLVRRLEGMAREVRRQAMGRKQAAPALTGTEMPRTKLSKAEQDGLAIAADAERRVAGAGGNLLAAWESLLADAKRCTRCHLYKHATQTVFGEGPLEARIMFVGEQPGDQEDLAGRPFVGLAGQLFDRALKDAGVDRGKTYVTNAVKHFKFEPRGKRRIHSKPQGPEIEACRWWIEQELELIRPAVTVALGATAARSIFGKVVTISRMRGEAHELPDGSGGEAWVTVHPSFLLRVPEEARKREEYGKFVEDLRRIGARAKALA